MICWDEENKRMKEERKPKLIEVRSRGGVSAFRGSSCPAPSPNPIRLANFVLLVYRFDTCKYSVYVTYY